MSKNKKNTEANNKSLESWIWDAACSIRGAKDAPKYKDYILPLIFAKRLCDVFDDELDRIATEVGSRHKAFRLVEAEWRRVADKKKAMVRFYLPLNPKDTEQPVWSVIRKLSEKIGEGSEGIARIADILIKWKEEEKLSRIVAHAELKHNDYNISPSRYIHTGDAETYRPLEEIVKELDAVEAEARETDKALRDILARIGV